MLVRVDAAEDPDVARALGAFAVPLQALGCRVIKGYLFGRPVPAGEFERRLRTSWPAPDLPPFPKAKEQPAVY